MSNLAGHGGARVGAGRKPGSITTKTREITEAALAAGITPLEVMLQSMREFHDKGEFLSACSVAKDAAPYVHPRLAAMEHSGPDGGPIQVTVARFVEDAVGKSGT